MRYYVVFLKMLDLELSQKFRPEHLDYLAARRAEGKIFANGRFFDGTGGLVIYQCADENEVLSIVERDPYIIHQARTYEIHEWELFQQ